MKVEKSFCHRGMTLAHGCFQVREVVHVCARGCRHGGRRVRQRHADLAAILLPRSTVGYDVMTFVGLERFVHHRQREEIRAALRERYDIVLSSGEVSTLGRRFLVYLEALQERHAADVRAVLAECRRLLVRGGRVLVIEDIPAISRLNLVGHLIHRVENGEHIRPVEEYQRLYSEAGTIESGEVLQSGICDYYAAVLVVNQ